MYISNALKQDLDSKGVPGWFVHEIFSHEYNTDGELLGWTFLPYVAELPIFTEYRDRYGSLAGKQSSALTNAAMQIAERCFLVTPGFKKLGSELKGCDGEYSQHAFFNKIRLKYDHRVPMSRLIENGFWASYRTRPGAFGYNPINQAAHAAHVFSAAFAILGEDAWTEAVRALQSLKGNK